MFKTFFSLLTFCTTCVFAGAEYDFAAGKSFKWKTQKFEKVTFAAGKGLVGTRAGSKDVRLVSPELVLKADETDSIAVAGQGRWQSAKLYFSFDGKTFNERQMIRGACSGSGVVFDVKKSAVWKGVIKMLRVDIFPGSSSQIAVQKISFRKKTVQQNLAIDFADGNRHKWRCYGFKSGKFVRGRGFQGISSGSGKLISEHLNIPADQADVLEIAVKGKWKSAKLYFHDKVSRFREGAMVRGEIDDGVIIFDVGRNPHWKGVITALRLDGYGNQEFFVKSIRFRKSDGTISLKSPWMTPVTVGAGEAVSAVREPRFPRPVFFRGNVSEALELHCRQFDIFGKLLGEEKTALKSGAVSGMFRYIPNTASFTVRIANRGAAAAKFDLSLFQREKTALKALAPVKLNVLNVPSAVNEKSVWTPQVEFAGAVPEGRRLRLHLKGDPALDIIVADVKIQKNNSRKCTLTPVYFRYLTPGIYTVSAEIDGTDCVMNTQKIVHSRKSPVMLPKVEIDRTGNRPVYVINGKERIDTMEYLISDPPPSAWALEQAVNAYSAGIKGIRLRLIFRFTPDLKLTFDEIDSAMQSILARIPEANLMLHVSVTDPGPGFRARYPEEGIKDEHGNFMIKNYRDKPEATSSMASKRWLNDSKTLLKRLIRHLENTPQGERVIGVLPCSGITWEWLNWGSARGVMVDYSEHFRQYFIAYLKTVYRNDINALNKAWHTAHRSFDEIKAASPARRKSADAIEFRTPFAYQPEIDLADCTSLLIADNVAELCKTVKQASRSRLLTGSYYGYSIYLNGAFRAHNAGHHALNRLLKSKEVDILSAPSRYAGRELGGGSGFMFPVGSVRLHNKLIISECDDRPINAGSATGRSATVAASRSAFERAYAMQFSAGAVMRWFDFSKGWVMDEPRMLDAAEKLSRFDQAMRKADPRPMPAGYSAAVITAERSAAVLSPDSALNDMLLETGYRNMVSSGVSFSIFNVEDFAAAVKDRKLILLVNLFRLRKTEKAAVEKLFAERGKIIFVCSGIGSFADDGKFDSSFASKLFKSRFQLSPERKIRTCRTTPQMEKLFGIASGIEITFGKPCGQILYPQGKEWIPLARTEKGDIAIGAKKQNGSLVIWAAHPVIPEDLFRQMAKKAGMPVIHAPKSAVWFRNGFGFVHTASGVKAVVEVPKNYSGICEFPDMRKRSAVNGRISKTIPPGGSWLFSFVSEK